jgi:hypothetical protein
MKLNLWLYLCLAMLLAAPMTVIGCGSTDDDDSAGDDDDTAGDDDDTTGDDDDTTGDDDDSAGDDDDSAAGDDDDSAAGDDDDSAGDDDDSAAGDDDDSAAAATPNCTDYCTARVANCSEDATACMAACTAAEAGMPAGDVTDTAGNTLGCRMYHTGVAATAGAQHCAHGNLFGGSSIDAGNGIPGFPCVNSTAEAYCSMAMAFCQGNIDNDGDAATPDGPLYAGADQAAQYMACMTAAGGFTAGSVGDTTGDTLECRLYHLEVAGSDAATHCPHGSPSGGNVCVAP